MIAYIALFSGLLSRLTALAGGSTWVTSFIACFLNIHWSGVLTALAWLVPHETAAVSAQVLYTPYNHAPCHFMQSHIRKVDACLAVTCHLHFWQNDRDLLRATAVTRGWNGYRNKSQNRKLTVEKKILQPLQPGLEPGTFRSNHWAIPTPHDIYDWNHWSAVDWMSKTEFRRERRIWWSKVSKAAERSNGRRTEMLSLSRAERISFTVRHKTVSALCPARQADARHGVSSVQ